MLEYFLFALGILFLIKGADYLIEGSSLLSVILILSLVGIIDDLFGWRQGGLSKRTRIFLVLFASVPLVVINAGNCFILYFLSQ